jgi:hypothetical protein
MSARYPGLIDLANALDPDGKVAAVIEILNQTNEMLADMAFMEGNLPTGHRSVIRTGLPDATWRKLYGRVQPDKSQRQQVTDSCGMLEAYHEVDVEIADLNGNTSEFRLSEARAQLEGMSQDLQYTALYGNTDVHPERFMGLSPRYNLSTATNGDNVIKAGGSGTDNASIWLISWSPETIYGIVPKGSQAGIQVNDKGQVTSEGADGLMEVYRTHFQLKAGLSVKDWRYAVRICNIDRSLLGPDPSVTGYTGANLPNLMFEAMEMLPSFGMGNTAFYMDRTIRTVWRQQMANAVKNSTLTFENVGGVKSPMFQEIPIRRVDQLRADEALVA